MNAEIWRTTLPNWDDCEPSSNYLLLGDSYLADLDIGILRVKADFSIEREFVIN